MAAKPFFVQEFASTTEQLSEVLENAVQALRERDWTANESCFCARLCLEEALVNAIVHGNHSNPSRKVRLEMTEQDDVCIIEIYDEGEGFSPGQATFPDCHDLGGRGVPLMKYYMDRVNYDKARGCLEMVLRRNPHAGGAEHGNA